MIVIIKNPKESFDRLMGRFNKKVQGSRIVTAVKSRRYYKKPPTKRKIRQAAIMREHYRSQRAKLQYY